MSFHKFNSLTGRLKQTSQLEALSPLSPRPLEKNLPQMMYDTIKTKPVATASSTQHYSTVSPKILKLRQEMQADMTKPVFLIRGTRDKVCFGATVALVAACTVWNFTNFIELKKKFK